MMKSTRVATARRAEFFFAGKKIPALRAVAKRGLIISMFFAVSPVMACPMCKDSTVDTEKSAVAESTNLDFNKSIYFMLGGLVTVVGFTGRVMWRATKSV